jgi:hypothetical protein
MTRCLTIDDNDADRDMGPVRAARLLAATSRDWSAAIWWSRWLDLQRASETDPAPRHAAERVTAGVIEAVGARPMRSLSVGSIREAITRSSHAIALPAAIAAILSLEAETSFIDAWSALAATAGVGAA